MRSQLDAWVVEKTLVGDCEVMRKERSENAISNREGREGRNACYCEILLLNWQRAYGMDNLALVHISMADNLRARLP